MVTKLGEVDTKVIVEPSMTFESTYAAHAAFVRTVLRRMGVHAAELDDAQQDVFLVWVRRGDHFRGEAEVGTYLHAIARRVASNRRRSDRRTRRRHDALQQVLALSPPSDPEDAIQHVRRLRALRREVQRLPTKLRRVYEMSFDGGLSAREIGATLDLSPNTVASRLRLSRDRLAVALNEDAASRPSLARRVAAFVLLPWRARVWPWAWLTAVPVVAFGVLSVGVSDQPPELAKPVVPALPELASGRERAGSNEAAVAAGATDPRDLAAAPPPPPSVRDRRPSNVVAPEGAGAREAVAAAESGRVDPVDTLGREATLIAQAQRHLRDHDFEAALAALRRHEEAFGRGILREERVALRAAALCDGGQIERGLLLARALAERAPSASALATAWASCTVNETSKKSDEPSPAGHRPD